MSPYLRSAEGDPAEPRHGAPVEVVVDGVPAQALPGQSVAAVLMGAGRDSWRTTRGGGAARGVFCGIGACFDCLVVVNGTPDVRACQRVVQAGDAITSQAGAVVPSAGTSKGKTRSLEVTGVVVVGAGPAGMEAAVAAADAGAEVLLVDAAAAVGGQFNRQLPAEFNARRPERLQHGWGAFVRLRDRIAGDRRITHLTSTSVWALERSASGGRTRLWLQRGPADAGGREVWAVEAPAVVLATGAYDRVLPFPGWDLPGVYSAGAAQALAKGQRVAVGRRVVVAGTGPFLLPVAESLVGVGAEVVSLLEANRLSTVLRGWLSDPLVARSKLFEALGYGGLLARRRIPLKHGWTVVAAHGVDRVEAVTVARLDNNWNPVPGTERRIEVDAVCLGFGFTPQLELAVSARCELGTGPDGGPAVVVDDHQQTTSPGIFAAGELTGIGGADLAAAEGRIAGAAAAGSLPSSNNKEKVLQHKRFAAALAVAYPVKEGWVGWSGAETVVCRCEGVSRGEVEEVVGDRGVTGVRGLKLTSRVGLGICQGRVCGRTVAALVGVQAEDRRPVGQPVRLGDLAGAEILEDL